MKLYPRSATPDLDLTLFCTPTTEYRGAPFWAWNSTLTRAQLVRQIAMFKAMGMGGFHIHARTGLATPYLSDAFMDLVCACVEYAQQESMLAWLYDEDRWPSGFAGGLVTADPRFRARHLLWTCRPYDGMPGKPVLSSSARADRVGNGQLIGCYHVVLRDGYLVSYRRLTDTMAAPPDGAIWFAYLETALPSPWFNNQTYVDTLNREATERFIAVTHERYASAVGAYFGGSIPAIFTDEPQFPHKQSFAQAEDTHDLIIPWTDDLLATYQQTYDQCLEDYLPELFWEHPDGYASLARYRYHDHVCERFTHAFADTLGSWCNEQGLALTGHLMEEPTLQSQTAALGEAMRVYRSFHIPGIDMLCDRHEYTTAKQAQSATHQYGRPGVLSELYGVTNWDFDFVGHKAQGDWQAALGVTVRVHHLAWVSMAGEAKRDYPAAIGYQSPWACTYPLIEDHFARLNTVLTRGTALVRVGVIHPIESYWLCFGPLAQTANERRERERAFADLTHWLLFGLIDFDFIAESLLPSLCPQQEGSQFQVGLGRYDVVIVPALRTIRATTLERLERFHTAGGTVIFAGEVPPLVDAQPSSRAQALAERCYQIDFTRQHFLDTLTSFREVAVQLVDGRPSDALLHQIRLDGDRRVIFFCNTDREQPRLNTQITINGEWGVSILDTLRGTSSPLYARRQHGQTVITWDFHPHSSLLLTLEPGWRDRGIPPPAPRWTDHAMLADPVSVTLAEPNVLLLDRAAYRLNNEAWQTTEEILRLDTLLRQRLGWPLRMEALAQPWTENGFASPIDMLSLRFTIHVDVTVEAPLLALENAAQVTISVDGTAVPSEISGWWVDEAIQTVPLPRLAVGMHELILTMPYGRQTNPEWCYLLGDFGVDVRGRHTRITAPVRTLAFGDWTRQGLPFYAGNVTYHCTMHGCGTAMAVRAPKFKAPLLSVALDGQEVGPIAFAPFQCGLGTVATGMHTLDITVYGNRVNAFGTLHNANEKTTWFGPDAWRTVGDAWAYEYQLKPMGLLVAPRVLTRT